MIFDTFREAMSDDPKRRKVSRILLPVDNHTMSHPALKRAELVVYTACSQGSIEES
jgi:hypothetical protein